ncbi:MAG: PAS domain S-box protein [Nitrospirae bacterium]|nr:PAS domain S-box protein [Nitrospirota bacterium]
MMGKQDRGISGWSAIWIFVILGICIVLVGYAAFDIQKGHIKGHIQKELLTITRIKIEQIATWRNERLMDATDIHNNPLLAVHTEEYINDRRSETKRELLYARLISMKENHMFIRVMLTDGNGTVILSTQEDSSGGSSSIEMSIKSAFKMAMKSKDVVMSDLYLDTHNVIRLSLVIPILKRESTKGEIAGEVIGVFLVDVDPYDGFFSLVQTWPVESNTAETLLIRREGSDVVYLNELRHRKGTALVFRLPIDRYKRLPAAMVALGQRGVVEGYDYRGRAVLAAIMPVPDTPWFIVSKVDQDEIYQPIRTLSKVLVIIVSLLMALSGMGIGIIWQRRNAAFRQRHYEVEERFRQVFDNAPIGIALSGKDYRFIDVNKHLCEMLKYSAEELRGMTFKDITHPDDLDKSVEFVNKLRNNEIPFFRIEKRHVTKSGKILWDNTISSVIRDEKGRGLYNIAMIEDITARKEMEDCLIHAKRLYAVLSQVNQSIVRIKGEAALFNEICHICLEYGDFTMAWIGLIDQETGLVEPVAFAGIEEETLSGIVMSIVNRPDMVCPTTTAIRNARHSICNDVTTDPVMTTWRDEAFKRGYLSLAAFPIMIHGVVIGTLSLGVSQKNFFLEPEIKLLEEVADDISFALEAIAGERDKKISEQAIERQSRRNKMILDVSLDGFVLVDQTGKIRDANRAFSELLGYSYDELCSMRIMDVDIGQSNEEVVEHMKKIIQVGHSRFETILQHKDVRRINVEVSASCIELDDEIMIFAFHNDITEKKHRDKMFLLRERQAQMGEMLSIIAHQWKQPISAIAASVNRIELEGMFDTLDKGILNDSLERIKLQIQHLSQTINDFSTFFKPDKGKESSDITTIIKKALNIIGQQLRHKGIEVDLMCQSETAIETYVNELVQVFISILENAREALQDRGVAAPRVSINIHETDTNVVAEITDNAGGISPEIMDNIFFPYYSTKEKIQGTGLGLYMARMIVEEHCHGKLSAINTEAGVRFIIEIPKEDD